MNVFAVWLGACRKSCEALFASKGAGTDLKTKSVKRNEIPQRGQFNIMVCYGRKNSFDDVVISRKTNKRDIFPSEQELSNILPSELHPLLSQLFQ